MRANTIAPLASGAVVAGIIRSTLRCVLCGHDMRPSERMYAQDTARMASDGSYRSREYSVCTDCFAVNPGWLSSPLGARALRCAEFDPFPSRAINLVAAYRAARAANRSELAFKIAEYARSRRHLRALAPEHVATDRDWRAWRGFMQRFVVSTAFDDLLYRICTNHVAPGEEPYSGESLLERCGDIDGAEAIRALEYPGDQAECDEALNAACSVTADLLERPRPLNRARHEARVAEFLAKNATLDTVSVKSVRSYLRSRVFVGYRHPSGTYSFGFERTGAVPRRPTLVWRAEPAVLAAAA